MVKTVEAAFEKFSKDYVKLDRNETDKALKSRDWLVQQIKTFPNKEKTFPNLYSEKNMYFGSFARKTKIKDLDDIDIMITLSAESGSYIEYSDKIEIIVEENADILKKLCFEDSNRLNSRKVINKFIELLNKIPQYEYSDIKRNQEAATLKLATYKWNFDIVPCFFTKKDLNGNTHYLIPDGNGYWKKTDPRIEKSIISELNQINGGKLLDIIRIIKYWNKNSIAPTMPSYLLEIIILNYYQDNNKLKQHISTEISNILNFIKKEIYNMIFSPDNPKVDINILSQEEKYKISQKANEHSKISQNAINFASNLDNKKAIDEWRKIFGKEFSLYV
ncbi:TPA: nucleotidyltransferase [Staphylococcus aureus]|uniref:SMODS domain-containing nucleotidyltransferase n=1 Tax=Staphylococcus aureus TaxID=1280 RepID=UPI001455B4A2|nr:nucleotidyltransferase [Staphylococcus aureus]HDJ5521270.1 nucleotidyltransferase [Staphylococcus aureus]HDJ5778940.1 nucleotidyltransferase [Staphylococcus aureus]HDJ5795546.1 nucleotidyltransferase [Staphylococcus aureus]HDJ6356202.1 nucleotidyltransferase [Staphylococcus aureus]